MFFINKLENNSTQISSIGNYFSYSAQGFLLVSVSITVQFARVEPFTAGPDPKATLTKSEPLKDHVGRVSEPF